MKKIIVGAISVIAIGLLVLIVFEKQNRSSEKNQTTNIKRQQVQSTIETKPKIETKLKTIEMEAGSFYYKPNLITVKKGEIVKIIMKSVSMMHDFNIDELNVKMPIIKNGDTGTVEFTMDKAGTFEYYCSVGQHRQLGQVGKLIVI